MLTESFAHRKPAFTLQKTLIFDIFESHIKIAAPPPFSIHSAYTPSQSVKIIHPSLFPSIISDTEVKH